MDRRLFCRSLFGAASAMALGTSVARAAGHAAADPYLREFAAHRAGSPWLMGYEGLAADVAPMPLRLHGRIPRELRGAFYRNGPARHSLGGMRYHHLFDGDGMLQKYQINDGGIVHQGRFVRTEKFVADSAAGRPVRAAFGTNPPGAEAIDAPDAINVANTSVLQHGGELMALWEGGSATRMDPQTLDTLGFKVWNAEYAGMPFSAHPKIEPDGTLWNFGITSSLGLLSIYRVAPSGELVNASTFKVPQMPMVHDFAVTERHLVFLLSPLVYDDERSRAGATFLDSHVWRPELGLRVLVVDKNELERQQWFELPAGFVFHIGNAWEDAAGVIRLDCIRSADATIATADLRALMQGRYEPTRHAAPMLVELDLKAGRAQQTVLDHTAEFPRIDPRHVGRRYSQVFVAERIAAGTRPGFDAVTRLDTVSGKIDRYRYGADIMVEEHVFVPKRGGRRRRRRLAGRHRARPEAEGDAVLDLRRRPARRRPARASDAAARDAARPARHLRAGLTPAHTRTADRERARPRPGRDQRSHEIRRRRNDLALVPIRLNASAVGRW